MNAPSSRRRSLGRSAAIVSSTLCLAAACSTSPPPRPVEARPVKTMVVSAGDELRTRAFPGAVEASRRVELTFQVPGLLAKLPVREGQKVAKGDVIAELRQDEFRARLATLQGQLDQGMAGLEALRRGERTEEIMRRETQVRAAGARLANARAQFQRQERLLRANATARASYEVAETEYRVAQQEHQAARRTLEMGSIGREEDIQAAEASVRGLEGRVVEANIQLEDSTLRAPYDGIIAQRFVEEGQNVRAKQPIVRFQDVDEIDIAIDVPETVMAADIRTADIVEMVAEVSGAPGLEFPVELREVAQVADPTTQTFKVSVSMKAPESVRLLPGMTATVTVRYRRASILGTRILVPVTAVSNQDSEAVVWIIDADQNVSRRPVQIREVTGGLVEIVDGIGPGDRIAVAGVRFLHDGMKVRDLGDALGGGS